MVVEGVERRGAESADDPGGELPTDAFHQAGAEMPLHARHRRRRNGKAGLDLELPSPGGVGRVGASYAGSGSPRTMAATCSASVRLMSRWVTNRMVCGPEAPERMPARSSAFTTTSAERPGVSK